MHNIIKDLSQEQIDKWKDQLDKIAEEVYGEFGFETLHYDEKIEAITILINDKFNK